MVKKLKLLLRAPKLRLAVRSLSLAAAIYYLPWWLALSVAFILYYFPPIAGLSLFILFGASLFLAFVSLPFLSIWIWWLIAAPLFYLFFGLGQRRFVNHRHFSQIFIFLLFTLCFAGFALNYVGWLMLALVLFFGALLLFGFFAEIDSSKRIYLFAGAYALITLS